MVAIEKYGKLKNAHLQMSKYKYRSLKMASKSSSATNFQFVTD